MNKPSKMQDSRKLFEIEKDRQLLKILSNIKANGNEIPKAIGGQNKEENKTMTAYNAHDARSKFVGLIIDTQKDIMRDMKKTTSNGLKKAVKKATGNQLNVVNGIESSL